MLRVQPDCAALRQHDLRQGCKGKAQGKCDFKQFLKFTGSKKGRLETIIIITIIIVSVIDSRARELSHFIFIFLAPL